ncbi:hypothetical protein V1264_007557 [Littorina saxatilis]|uniref:Glycosyltransferase 8 domain-containing protein 1 n=1 Tax=Littorina saxatilis TaxID=31220 RepID=A0AAN9G3W4_9CAEN
MPFFSGTPWVVTAITAFLVLLQFTRQHPGMVRNPFSANNDVNAGCKRHVDMDTVHVIIMADVTNFIGMLTLANSILQNTKSDVMFHFVTYPSDVTYLREWIQGGKLKDISYKIIEFSKEKLLGKFLVRSPRSDLASPLNFARLFLPDLLPCVGRVIFIDADCLVLGDISDLYHVNMAPGDVAAGLRMCDFYDKSIGLPTAGLVLNASHPEVKKANISKDVCMMNGGVYVADLMKWEQHNISQQLQFWMELNTREPVFKYGDNGSGTQAVLIAVLHDKYTPIPKEWNTISGSHTSTPKAKLVHWNGLAKPWLYPGLFVTDWLQYYVPDPHGRYRPRNVWHEKKAAKKM